MFKLFFKYKYLMVILVGILSLILAVPYLWCDPLIVDPKRFSYQINDEKVTNYFTTLLTIIGTALTAYYLEKQLKSANAGIQPTLYPERTTLIMKDFVTDEKRLPTVIWEKEGPGRFVEVLNLGNGIAKKIKFTWIYDTSLVIELIRNIYDYNENDLNNIAQENKTEINFIGREKFAPLFLPHFYLKCCGLKLISPKDNGTNFIRSPKRPPLKLLVEYEDIQNNNCTQMFNVEIYLRQSMITMNFVEQPKPVSVKVNSSIQP